MQNEIQILTYSESDQMLLFNSSHQIRSRLTSLAFNSERNILSCFYTFGGFDLFTINHGELLLRELDHSFGNLLVSKSTWLNKDDLLLIDKFGKIIILTISYIKEAEDEIETNITNLSKKFECSLRGDLVTCISPSDDNSSMLLGTVLGFIYEISKIQIP